jgi:hypothetical protein
VRCGEKFDVYQQVKMAMKTTKRNVNAKDYERERMIVGSQREVGDDEWIK